MSRPHDGKACGAGEAIRAYVALSVLLEVAGNPALALALGNTRVAHPSTCLRLTAVHCSWSTKCRRATATRTASPSRPNALALNGGSIRKPCRCRCGPRSRRRSGLQRFAAQRGRRRMIPGGLVAAQLRTGQANARCGQCFAAVTIVRFAERQINITYWFSMEYRQIEVSATGSVRPGGGRL